MNKTTVVNVKVANLRPKYSNLKDWIENKEENYYIGRKGIVFVDKERFPKTNSPFANIYKVGKDGTLEAVLSKYKEYITKRLDVEESLRSEFQKLRGKKLGCWCKPNGCHGDVLLSLLSLLKYQDSSLVNNNNNEDDQPDSDNSAVDQPPIKRSKYFVNSDISNDNNNNNNNNDEESDLKRKKPKKANKYEKN